MGEEDYSNWENQLNNKLNSLEKNCGVYLWWWGAAAGTRESGGGNSSRYDQTQAAINSSHLPYIIMCENNLIQVIQARDEASELEQRTRRVPVEFER